jgi:TusA-related sulfurtransferase
MSETPEPIFEGASFYDAGDQGCSTNLLGIIRQRLQTLQPGEQLEIRSTDPTVAVDLPAWCRLTNTLLVAQEQTSEGATYFLIQRKP